MKLKAGDFVEFKNFGGMPNDNRYNVKSSANNFHKNYEGKKMKIYEIDGAPGDWRIVLEENRRFQFKTERFVQYNMGIKLDDDLFQL